MNPPDQPTPRTNAIAHRGYPEPSYIVEMTDLARILERELAAARSERDLNITRVASILWSGAIDKQTCGDVQKWAADYTAELARLRAQESDYVKMIAEVLKCEPRSASEQSDNRLEAPWDVIARLRAQLSAIEEDGTEEHNAAVGLRQKLVAALDRAEKAEAEAERWSALAKSDATAGNRTEDERFNLAQEVKQLRAENAQLKLPR